MSFITDAVHRLMAHDFGDLPPRGWTQGDKDVTFTPFCKVIRRVLGADVAGITGTPNQERLWVYVSKITAKQLISINKLLKAAQIPGSPRFNNSSIATSTSYAGMLVLTFHIY